MVFGNGVKNIQAAAYNGARTVYKKPSTFLLLSINFTRPLTKDQTNGDYNLG